MDVATATAFRAVISGLRRSGAIQVENVEGILRELEAAEPDLKRWGTEQWIRYRCLCMEIATDAGVPTSIKSAEPPMEWGF